MPKRKINKVRRKVTIGVVAPVTATLIVEGVPGAGEWTPVSLTKLDTNGSLSVVRENLDEDGWDELDRLAELAENLP